MWSRASCSSSPKDLCLSRAWPRILGSATDLGQCALTFCAIKSDPDISCSYSNEKGLKGNLPPGASAQHWSNNVNMHARKRTNAGLDHWPPSLSICASRVMLEMAKAKMVKTQVTAPRQSTTWHRLAAYFFDLLVRLSVSLTACLSTYPVSQFTNLYIRIFVYLSSYVAILSSISRYRAI